MPKIPFNLGKGFNNLYKSWHPVDMLGGAKLQQLNLARGLKGGAGAGAAVGGVAGGLHGAVTSDPNNPNEGRLGRIVSHAAGGAMLGAGGGAALGGGKAHLQNVGVSNRVKGLVEGGALGFAAGKYGPNAKAMMQGAGEHLKDFAGKVAPGAQEFMQSAGNHLKNFAGNYAGGMGENLRNVGNTMGANLHAGVGKYFNPEIQNMMKGFGDRAADYAGSVKSRVMGTPAAAAKAPGMFQKFKGLFKRNPVGANGVPTTGMTNDQAHTWASERAATLRAEKATRDQAAKGASTHFWTSFMQRAHGEN